MNSFNSNNFIKSLKERYDSIPHIQGDDAAKIMVGDSIKENHFNPEDVLSFICSTMGLSNTLTEEDWKNIINRAIKENYPVAKSLQVYMTSLKGKISYEEMFKIAASVCDKDPIFLKYDSSLDNYGWLNAVKALIKTSEETKAEHHQKKKDPRCVAIIGIKDGAKKEWSSYKECEKETGAGHGTVSQFFSGKVKSVKGWILYKKDDEPKDKPVVSDHPRKKAVCQFGNDKKGHLVPIKTWSSVTEASNALGINHASISKAANGSYQTAGGFTWKYAEAL